LRKLLLFFRNKKPKKPKKPRFFKSDFYSPGSFKVINFAMGINLSSYSTCMKSFNFRSTVLTAISFDERKGYS